MSATTPLTALVTLFAPVCPSTFSSSSLADASDFLINWGLPVFFPLAALILGYALLAFTATKKRHSKLATTKANSSASRPIPQVQDQELLDSISIPSTLKPKTPCADPGNAPEPELIQEDYKTSLLLTWLEGFKVNQDSLNSPAPAKDEQFNAIVLNSEPDDDKPQIVPPSVKSFEYYLRWDLPDEELEQLSYSEKAKRYYILTNPPAIKVDAPQLGEKESSNPTVPLEQDQALLESANEPIIRPDSNLKVELLKEATKLDVITFDQAPTHIELARIPSIPPEHPSKPPERLNPVLYENYRQILRDADYFHKKSHNKLIRNDYDQLMIDNCSRVQFTFPNLDRFNFSEHDNFNDSERLKAKAKQAAFLLSLLP